MNIKKKREILRRLRIIEGHIGKVIKMIEEDRYCIDVLQQSLAVQNALKEADSLVLDTHLHSCVVRAFEKGKKREKATKELLELFKKRSK